jgi:hypothetical protein
MTKNAEAAAPAPEPVQQSISYVVINGPPPSSARPEQTMRFDECSVKLVTDDLFMRPVLTALLWCGWIVYLAGACTVSASAATLAMALASKVMRRGSMQHAHRPRDA